MHLPMFNSYFISSFPFYPLLPTSIMCFQYIPVVSHKRSYIKRRRQRNLAHLRSISPSLPLSFSMGLWNCQSVVNKADLIHFLQNHTVKRKIHTVMVRVIVNRNQLKEQANLYLYKRHIYECLQMAQDVKVQGYTCVG